MPHVVVKAREHNRSRSLGWLAVRWIEHFCIHGPGDIQGKPLSYKQPDSIPLSDELSMLTVDCYALEDDGSRLYDSAFFSRPKGANKSGYASWIALFEALGPCRFLDWAKGGEVFEWLDFRHVYDRGEPMGRPVTYPFLRILATEEGQTGNVYDAIFYNLREGPLREAFNRQDDIGLTRVFLPGGGEIRPSTASSSAKDGGKETWANFDETHLYVLPELRRMYDTVRRNMTKRKDSSPWSLETSTMYQPGQDSVAERSHKLAEMVRQGGKVVTPRFFFDHREAPSDTDLANEESLRAGMAEAYGDSWVWQDQDRKVREVMDIRNDVTDSRRFSLNQVTAAYDAWITAQQFDSCIREGHLVPIGAQIAVGLDGSETDDHTFLVACEIETGYMWPVGHWNPALEADHKVPKAAVDRAIALLREQYDVVAFYSDVHPFEDYIDKWTAEFGEDLCARATQIQPIKWYMNRETEATKAAEAYYTAIIDHFDLSFPPLLSPAEIAFRQQHLNCRRRPNRHGITIGKGLQTEKIDAAAASMLARKARQDYLALPDDKKRRKRSRRAVFA